jgi:hypothetical protein
MAAHEDTESREALEARVDALSSLIRSVLTTLVLRGVLNRADIPALLHETETAMQSRGAHAAAASELRSIRDDMPNYLRAAMGPAPDPDEDEH